EERPDARAQIAERDRAVTLEVGATVAEDDERGASIELARMTRAKGLEDAAVARVLGRADDAPREDRAERSLGPAVVEEPRGLGDLAHEDEGARPCEQRLRHRHELEEESCDAPHRLGHVAEHHELRTIGAPPPTHEPKRHAERAQTRAERPAGIDLPAPRA